MLPNLIPALILIPLINWFVPWFISRFDFWHFKTKLFVLTLMTLFIFLLFIIDYPVTLFRNYSFYKYLAGEEIYMFNPAELFFFLTLGISLLVIFLTLLSAGKTKWFAVFTGMIIFAFCLNIFAVYSTVQISLANYATNNTLNAEESVSGAMLKKPKISLAFIAKYLTMKFIGKSSEVGQQAIIKNDLYLWHKYHYLENLLYSDNNVWEGIEQVSSEQLPSFIKVLKHERGYDSEMIEALKAYNTK